MGAIYRLWPLGIGASTLLNWSIRIDWDNNGSYQYDESDRVTSLRIERGRADEFSPVQAGKCTLTLDNYDRRFDPWYVSSPIYPGVKPRRGVRVHVSYYGQTYPLFYGKIEDVEPQGRLGKKEVIITAYDGLRDLVAESPDVTIQESITTDTAIGAVLTAAGWPVADRDLDTGSDTLAYFWAPGGQTARDLIEDLARSEHGMVYVSKDGKLAFMSRLNYVTAEAESQSLNEDNMTDIAVTQPWESIYNIVSIACKPVQEASSANLWTLQDTAVSVARSTSVTLTATYQDANGQACAAIDVISPIATTDYTASNTQGGAANRTADMTVAATIKSTSAELVVSNTGTRTFWITLLKIRGKAIMQETTTIEESDSTSQTDYDKRKLTIDVPWQQSIAVATDMAQSLLVFYKDPHKTVTCVQEMVLPAILVREIGKRYSVVSDLYDIDETMRLGQMTLETLNSMQALKATYRFEPCDNLVYWLLGVVGHSELGETTRLGY